MNETPSRENPPSRATYFLDANLQQTFVENGCVVLHNERMLRSLRADCAETLSGAHSRTILSMFTIKEDYDERERGSIA